MGTKISILYAGEKKSKAKALLITGKLLDVASDEDEINNYQLDDYDSDELSYLDKVDAYITKVSRNDKIVIVLSKKYLTESIFCQEEIREIVSKYKNNFRENVFVIYAEEDMKNDIRDEAKNNIIKNQAHDLIRNYIEKLKKVKIKEERIAEVQYCIQTSSFFLDELRRKRDFIYSSNDIDKIVEDISQNISSKVKKNNSSELEKFLSMFNKCFSDETYDEYGDPLNTKIGLNNDLITINDIYKKCMLPELQNTNIVDLVDIGIENIKKEDTSNYIALKFYRQYYLMPMAVKYELIHNGDIDDGRTLDTETFINNLKDDFDEGKLIYLIGGVGEGKSTFIKKIIYDLSIEDDSSDYKLVYYKFNGKDSVDEILTVLNQEIDNTKQNILFIDELDSFSHVYERFMFTPDGYTSFKEQIRNIKNIIEELKEILLKNEVQSIVVSVRPYVLSHFRNRTLINLNRNGSLYKLQYPEDAGEKIIRKRIDLFKSIVADIVDSNQVREGTKKVFIEYKEDITNQMIDKLFEVIEGKIRKHIIQTNNGLIYVPIPKKHEPINKLLKLSTHGFRTLLTLYNDLGYNPKLYNSYFNTTVFLFYVLGLYKKYCQILPLKYNENPKENYTGKVFNYPNMFLSIASSETNKDNTCAIPHTITYWLKIFLLDFIKKNKKISIDKILEEFKNFDKGLVLIALGSLGTINEYNCIEYDFPSHQYEDLNTFLSHTQAKLTRRGLEIISNDIYMDYNNLEFFVDDWQLPKPKIDVILGEDNIENDFYSLLERLNSINFTYEHLIGKQDSDFSFEDFISDKARLVIWYTYIFEISLKKEKEYYHIQFFEREKHFFQNKRKKIQSEANAIYRTHYPSSKTDLTKRLEKFNEQCINVTSLIEDFFDEVFKKDIKVSCFKC